MRACERDTDNPPIVVNLTITASAGKPGEPPPEVRLRRWLKVGLRTFGIRVEWAPPTGEGRR